MAYKKAAPGEKKLDWVGDSLETLRSFPEDVKDFIGTALSVAQFGGTHSSAAPWRGAGSQVFEIRKRYKTDTYRAVYTVEFENVVYVVHAFKKKSTHGIKTPQHHINTIHQRLQRLRAEGSHGKEKTSSRSAKRR